jgi:hypothetical protein
MDRFIRHMEMQGVGVTRTKKGLLLRLPDGKSTMVHFTTSDVNAIKSLKARLRRSGVSHPDDNKIIDLPEYITGGTVKQESKEKFYAWVRKNGYPPEVYGQDLVKALNVDPGQVNRVLYHSGFTAQRALSRKGRAWRTPDWLLEEKIEADEATVQETVIPDDARELSDPVEQAMEEFVAETAEEEHDREIETEEPDVEEQDEDSVPRETPVPVDTMPEPPHSEELTIIDVPAEEEPEPPVVEGARKDSFHDEREFIDSTDSWTVSLEELLGYSYATVAEKLKVLEVLGLEYEFRVWRK